MLKYFKVSVRFLFTFDFSRLPIEQNAICILLNIRPPDIKTV